MDGSRATTAAALAFACAVWCASARGESTARLDYRRDAGAEDCPDEAGLRRAVTERLGRDPFDDTSESRFTVSITGSPGALVGRITREGDAGQAEGVRELSGRGSCSELVDALALALSLAINPELALGGPPAAPPPVERPTPPEPAPRADAAPRAATTAAPRDTRFHFALGPVVYGVAGASPEPTFGFGGVLRVRRTDLSLSLEGRYDLTAKKELATAGQLETQLAAGLLVPCVHFSQINIQTCAVGAVGRLRAAAPSVPVATPASGVYAAAGLRLAVEMTDLPYARLAVRLDVLASLVPVEVTRNHGADPLWELPPVSASLGLGGLLEVP